MCVQIPEVQEGGVMRRKDHTRTHMRAQTYAHTVRVLLGLGLMNMNVINSHWNVKEVNAARNVWRCGTSNKQSLVKVVLQIIFHPQIRFQGG